MESVGWLFFGAVLAPLWGAAIYLIFKVKYESTSTFGVVAMGFIVAAVAAAVITAAVNSILQYRARRRRAAERRTAQRRKVHK